MGSLALPIATAALELTFAYYAIPRMYNLPLKTIAIFLITTIVVSLLSIGLVKITFKVEKLKDHVYLNYLIRDAIITCAAFIAWHATSLSNDPMPVKAALFLFCFSYLLNKVQQVVAKFFNVKITSRMGQLA